MAALSIVDSTSTNNPLRTFRRIRSIVDSLATRSLRGLFGVFRKDDRVDRYHASFGCAFDLPDLLDYLAVGRIVEKHCPRNSSGSRILFNRLAAYGGIVSPEQPDELSQNDRRHV